MSRDKCAYRTWMLLSGLITAGFAAFVASTALPSDPNTETASSKDAPATHLTALKSTDLFPTGGFTVDPGGSFPALTVPNGKTFVLTDVIVCPLVEKSNADFIVRYRIEGNKLTKFQYNTVGTTTNWSQHFSSGIPFAAGTKVEVVNTTFSTGRTGFQLLGYLITP